MHEKEGTERTDGCKIPKGVSCAGSRKKLSGNRADFVVHLYKIDEKPGQWCATRQVDNEKNINFLYCPVCAGQYFYVANNRS